MSNDMQYIAHSDTDIRAARSMVASLGESVERAGENIQEGLQKIAINNKEIAEAKREAGRLTANAVLEAGRLVENGLAQIADEMRRRTYTDEYYLLLDRIDSLEDKIIARSGKKIQEIYDSLENNYIPTIALSNSEILTMYSCMSEETMEWFKNVASMYKVNPWNVFYNALETCTGIVYRIPFEKTYYVAYYSDHRIPIYYEGCYTKEYAKEISDINGNGRIISQDTNDSRYMRVWNEPNYYIKNTVCSLKKKFDKEECLSIEQLKRVKEFNAFVNDINVEIMMENIRSLHTELRKVYRQMK